MSTTHEALLTAVGKDLNSPEFERGGLRSPGFGFGGGPRSPPLPEDTVLGDDVFNSRASFSRNNTGGVKRTKSLMQKIKSMVRRESEDGAVPAPMSDGVGYRSQSMSDANPDLRRPSHAHWRDAPVVEEEEGEDDMDFTEAPARTQHTGSMPVPIRH